ncbi:MAG: hypothetical protein K2Y33_05425, partial [Mycolicibacterium frederiksbergense]|nr:hypothetical protein [Mycolicibacterium frederiksbergense]
DERLLTAVMAHALVQLGLAAYFIGIEPHSDTADADAAPDWPAVTGDGPWMSLQPDGPRVVTDFDDIHQCDFWAGLTG